MFKSFCTALVTLKPPTASFYNKRNMAQCPVFTVEAENLPEVASDAEAHRDYICLSGRPRHLSDHPSGLITQKEAAGYKRESERKRERVGES